MKQRSLIFYKYHGTGNDFIMLDNRDNNIFLNTSNIAFMCNRHLGIGADGLIMIERHDDYDFKMRYFNSDGKEASMCGNGGRCIVLFAYDIGIKKDNYLFDAVDGIHEAIINEGNNQKIISLKMKDVNSITSTSDYLKMDTGSPHVVLFKDNIKDLDVNKIGREIRNLKEFEKGNGVNVNFVEQYKDYIAIRTYERGVEAETLSCGTGTVASAIAVHIFNKEKDGAYIKTVETQGGILKVSFTAQQQVYKNIVLSGTATYVFKGEISI